MKVRWGCLILLFFIALFAITRYGGTISYSFLIAVSLVPVLSLVYLGYIFLKFRVHQEVLTRNIIAGQPVPYSFILHNDGRTVFTNVAVKLYADFSRVEEIPDNRRFQLFPGDRCSFQTMLTCLYRGEYAVGVDKIILTDFLGLFRVKYRIMTHIEAIVKPRIIRLMKLAGMPEPEVCVQSESACEKNENDSTVRDYIQGDSLKQIHWKATARSGTLKVRRQIGTLKQRILLLSELERPSADRKRYLPIENKILEIIIAILYYFSLQNTGVELLWKGQQTERRSMIDGSRFSDIYEELSMIRFTENGGLAERSFPLFFREVIQSGFLWQGMVCFIVLSRMDEGLYAAISELAERGKILVVYVVTDEDLSCYIRQNTARIRIIAIEPEEEIEGKL